MKKYKKYDDRIKEMVVESRNPDLFPELNIPRTTAIYWIRQAKKKIKPKSIGTNNVLIKKIESLENELKVERAKNTFLTELLKNLHGVNKLYHTRKNKEVIVDLVDKYCSWVSKTDLCKLIRIRSDKYHKLKVQTKGCKRIAFNKCKINSANQITHSEQMKIHRLANDPKLSHLSVKGLQYYGLRYEDLYCGYDSWRKYVNEFKFSFTKKKRKKKRHFGIRANRKNEIWHIDITEFKLRTGEKVYLQVLMDNFSRRILNWQMSFNKSQILTIKNITKATKEIKPDSLMSDSGGENISHEVRRLLIGKNISKIIAKKDVVFSNSMVESFFNILKTRFINKYKKYSFSKLYKKITKAIKLFNTMPAARLDGATPDEVYHGLVSTAELKSVYLKKRYEWLLIRPELNRLCIAGKQCF